MSKKSAILILLFAFVSKLLNAKSLPMTEQLMQQGKIYAVIAIVGVILLGVFAFLFYLERRLRNLEQEIKK